MPGVRIFLELLNYTMKRRIIRNDLMSVSEYAKKYGTNRVRVYKMIDNGELTVEHISGTDYIRLKVDAEKV